MSKNNVAARYVSREAWSVNAPAPIPAVLLNRTALTLPEGGVRRSTGRRFVLPSYLKHRIRAMTHDTAVKRPSNRAVDMLRSVSFELGVNKHAEGSCLVKFGDTHVLCLASVEEQVPSWLKNSGKGWVTAEYGMLPRATNTRMPREAAKGGQSGRTQEIQRLVGRALRAVTDIRGFGEIQVRVDCDVIQADGGTRTAGITGAYLALYQAFATMKRHGAISKIPLREPVAAVSCGLYQGVAVLDLDYAEDSAAQADANFVLTASGKIVEIQGTAEDQPFAESEFFALLELAKKGVVQLVDLQRAALLKAGL